MKAYFDVAKKGKIGEIYNIGGSQGLHSRSSFK